MSDLAARFLLAIAELIPQVDIVPIRFSVQKAATIDDPRALDAIILLDATVRKGRLVDPIMQHDRSSYALILDKTVPILADARDLPEHLTLASMLMMIQSNRKQAFQAVAIVGGSINGLCYEAEALRDGGATGTRDVVDGTPQDDIFITSDSTNRPRGLLWIS